MRSVLALLGGMSISALGVALTLAMGWDLLGVLLIAAGALVAALCPRALVGVRLANSPASASTKPRVHRSLGARLAQASSGRRRAG